MSKKASSIARHLHYRLLKGVWFKGGGYKRALGNLRQLREYKAIMVITRLPTHLGPPPPSGHPNCRYWSYSHSNITPIYYDSFHFLFRYPSTTNKVATQTRVVTLNSSFHFLFHYPYRMTSIIVPYMVHSGCHLFRLCC